MTGRTPLFGLPYPTGGDPPCEGAAQIQALAQAYNDAVNVLDADLERLRNRPRAKVTYPGPGYAAGLFDPMVLQWSTVEVDVGGWAQLGVFPDRLFYPRAGRYVVGVDVEAQAAEIGSDPLTVNLSIEGMQAVGFRDPGAGPESLQYRASVMVDAAAGDILRAIIGPPLFILRGQLWGYWIGD